MEEIIFNYLKEKKLINYKNLDIGKNKLIIKKNEVQLEGNKLGLIMLADYLVSIALSKDENTHIHLDTINFFDNNEIYNELIIIKKCYD